MLTSSWTSEAARADDDDADCWEVDGDGETFFFVRNIYLTSFFLFV
jgi:hypothetical protein